MDYNIFNKLYAAGKFSYFANGDPSYKAVAENAFRSSVNIYAIFSRESFTEAMRKENVPEEVINGYIETFTLSDDTYVTPKN